MPKGSESEEIFLTRVCSGVFRSLVRPRWAWARQVTLRSRIFDVNWYVITYPDVAQGGGEPSDSPIGAQHGRAPLDGGSGKHKQADYARQELSETQSSTFYLQGHCESPSCLT
jgi:hypothetical protein